MSETQNGYPGPTVSVIMPAYKQAEYVAEAIRSVKAQTFKDWELLIGDDGSPDNVAEIVKHEVADDPRIRFFHSDNQGVSSTRNHLAAKAKGEYLLPLDADHKIHPTYIEKCLAEFKTSPEIRLVYCRWKFFGASSHTPALSYSGYRNLLTGNTIFNAAMFRKSDLDRIGGYDEMMRSGYEDWEMWIRFLDEDAVVRQLPETLFFYRKKKESLSVSSSRPEREKEIMAYVYSKHKDLYDRMFPDRLGELCELSFRRKRMDKWKRRSIWSRLWYAFTGKL